MPVSGAGLEVVECVKEQLAGLEVPGVAQAEGQEQSRQVILEAAPVAMLAEPGGQGVASTELGGQKCPAGHKTGAPEEQ